MTTVPLDQLQLDVSRETMDRLKTYVGLLKKWNPAINLVARGTLDDAWSRHILDSAQLFALAPSTARTWLDLGSGGGFPGMVNAILAAERNSNSTHTLVESDQRKCAFLSQVARDLSLEVNVVATRIENLSPLCADVITARALAPLPRLLDLAAPHLAPNGICLFLKGARHREEIAEARVQWHMSYELTPSITDPDSVIMKLKALAHV